MDGPVADVTLAAMQRMQPLVQAAANAGAEATAATSALAEATAAGNPAAVTAAEAALATATAALHTARAALVAHLEALATQMGVSTQQLFWGLRANQGAAAQRLASLARQAWPVIEGVVSDGAWTLSTEVAGGAGTALTAAAERGALARIAQGAVNLARLHPVGAAITAAAVIAAAVYLGSGLLGTLSAGASIASNPEVEERLAAAHAEQTAQAANAAAVVPPGTGFVVVQVTNHAGRALSVRARSVYDQHVSGQKPLYLCNFLHGGRCSDYVVDTPRGPVRGQDIPADLSLLGEFRTAEDAWRNLCGRVTSVAPAPLAEGFVGYQGGVATTIDGANWMFRGAPCQF